MALSARLPDKTRGSGVCVAGAGTSLAILLAGCASQGPLQPPSLHLPAAVRDLSVNRVGDAVELHWTTPVRTSDGLLLTDRHTPLPLQADVCREALPGPCVPLGYTPVVPGRLEYLHDTLPAELLAGPPRHLRYRVRVVNALGRGSSDVVGETLAGTAPPAVEQLHASRQAGGVLLQWQPSDGRDGILLQVRRGASSGLDNRAAAAARSPEAVLLRVGPDPAGSSRAGTLDSGGTLDAGARAGVAQLYSIARTRTVRVGSGDLVMSSTPAAIAVAADARVPPPGPPAGLEAVANTLDTPGIDLVWQPNSAAEGYRVFRAEGSELPLLLTPEPVRGLTYSDKTARPGVRYRYSVAAVGVDGLAGKRSSEVTEGLPGR